ncbi:MAG: aminoglycoside phosphotransferase family protein [Christensenellales bacterium]|nr:aminoglycoside phosphotransferase family protein [Christensenellales bacterium]
MTSFPSAAERFAVNGVIIRCERYGSGHINETYHVRTDGDDSYILQKINRHVFQNVRALMENIERITGYLSGRYTDRRRSLHLVHCRDGHKWYVDDAGEYWRMYEFVEDSQCYQSAESTEKFYQASVGFASFLKELEEFPAATLHETLPGFHDTPKRYERLRRAVREDACNRRKLVEKEIEFAISREEQAGELIQKLHEGILPLRVTHNDTKLNNVLMDVRTGKALCIVDLDTVMPGLAAYDFGDSIRFGASTAVEDERDLSRVSLSLELYSVYVRGYAETLGSSLTSAEYASLPLGAKLMTLECGVRFLTDYLEGDHYFAVHRPGHNLDRCRTQFQLVANMEAKWQRMNDIVDEACRRYVLPR